MRLYPNRPQWVTIWLTAFMFAAALGQGERRVSVVYALVGALRAWSQAKSPARKWLAVAGSTVITIVILLAAVVLLHPKKPV